MLINLNRSRAKRKTRCAAVAHLLISLKGNGGLEKKKKILQPKVG